MGQVLGQLILTAASKELGDVPHIHAFNQGMMALQRNDHTNAAKFLRRLAERGDPRAQFWIGHFYSEGKGGFSQNLSEALKWFQRSADQKERNAQYFLGSMYFKGEGVPRDVVTSYMWFVLAAAQGDDTAAKARDALAAHMTPAQVAEGKKRASEWKPKTQTAAISNEQSIGVGTFDRGLIAFDRGDYANAARLLLPLAERGDARAQFLVGFMHRRGAGVQQNFGEALKWFRRAADQNESSGQRFLGSMYYSGEGVERDLVSAYVWFSLSDTQTKTTSSELADIAARLPPSQLAEAKKRISAWKPGTIASKSAAIPSQSTPQAGSPPLVGYGQISRSDGLKTFFVGGNYPNKSECERISKIFVDNWVASAKAGGHSAKLESSACEVSVPRDSAYDSLRHGTASQHYVFFTQGLRLMFVHERGTPDYEHAICEQMREATKTRDPSARCDAPKLLR